MHIAFAIFGIFNNSGSLTEPIVVPFAHDTPECEEMSLGRPKLYSLAIYECIDLRSHCSYKLVVDEKCEHDQDPIVLVFVGTNPLEIIIRRIKTDISVINLKNRLAAPK